MKTKFGLVLGLCVLAALASSQISTPDARYKADILVVVSLATWPTASVLEQVVRIFRLTRPEVVMTWLPSSVAGENHGDHQASGVIATQAFDMSGDPSAFPWQVAVPIRQFENALEGLS